MFFSIIGKIRRLIFCGRFESIKQNADKIGIKTITVRKIYGDIVPFSTVPYSVYRIAYA